MGRPDVDLQLESQFSVIRIMGNIELALNRSTIRQPDDRSLQQPDARREIMKILVSHAFK